MHGHGHGSHGTLNVLIIGAVLGAMIGLFAGLAGIGIVLGAVLGGFVGLVVLRVVQASGDHDRDDDDHELPPEYYEY